MYAKKVCILTTAHPPFDGRIFHRAGNTLVDFGYHVTLIAAHDRIETVNGIKIIPFVKPRSRISRMLATFRVLVLAFKERAGFYHFHDPELLPMGLILKIFTKAKVIYDVHEDYPKTILTKYYLPKSLRPYIMIAFNFFEKFVSLFFDQIVTATESIKEQFKHVSKKTSVIKNYPIPSDVFDQNNLRKDIANMHSIICTGSFDERHGIYEEVKSLEFVNDFNLKLKLIGIFANKEFENRLKSLPGSEKVEFLGWMPQDEVYKHLLKADIGLVTYHPLPYMFDARPTKIFEYMAAGLPILASNFPLWEKIILGNKCGITVNPLSSVDIADKINYLLSHPEEKRKMGENGRKAFIEKYNWGVEKKKLIQIYENLG